MKIRDILKEASSLSDLGVTNKGDISDIHRILKLKHDTKFEPVKNKNEALASLKKVHRPVIAVDQDGNAVGFSYHSDNKSGRQLYAAVRDEKRHYVGTASPAKALSYVKGRGWNWYVGDAKSAQSAYDREYSYDNADYFYKFLNDAEKFNPKIQEVASNLYKEAREDVFDMVENNVEDRLVSDAKFLLSSIKSVAEHGIEGYKEPTTLFKHAAAQGRSDALKMWLKRGSTYDRYTLDQAAADAKKNDPLAEKRFVRSVLETIRGARTKIAELKNKHQ